MNRKKSLALDLLIRAMEKIPAHNGERKNVTLFIESCYCGRVRRYDFDAALDALARLNDEEEHALIEHVVRAYWATVKAA
jgi:hypothetical protein